MVTISEKVLHQTDLIDRDVKSLARDLRNAVGISVGTIVCNGGTALVSRDNDRVFKVFNQIGSQVLISSCHKSINGIYTITGSVSKNIDHAIEL